MPIYTRMTCKEKVKRRENTVFSSGISCSEGNTKEIWVTLTLLCSPHSSKRGEERLVLLLLHMQLNITTKQLSKVQLLPYFSLEVV